MVPINTDAVEKEETPAKTSTNELVPEDTASKSNKKHKKHHHKKHRRQRSKSKKRHRSKDKDKKAIVDTSSTTIIQVES